MAVDGDPAAHAEHRDLGQRRDGRQGGGELGREPHEPGPGGEEVLGPGGQVGELAVLLAEALDHAHAGDRLVDDPGHLAGPLLRVPRGREDLAAQPERDDEEQRQGHEHDQRQRR
jgi:hypothetical protein